jgi:hypothetical protein
MPDSSPADDVTSSDTTLDVAATPAVETTETSDSNRSDSSSTKAVSMIDAVQAALEPKEASPPSPNQDQQPPAADSEAPKADGEIPDDLSEDELKALSWKAQQRFKKLASTLKTRDGEVTTLKTKADEYDKIVGSINKAGLDNREVDELIEIGSLLKKDPARALAALQPIVDTLRDVAGEILPPELQERVRLGYISESDARELHKAKVNEGQARRTAERESAERKAADEATANEKLISTSVSAVEAWEKQQAATDPDWTLKQKEVAEQVELAIVREAQKRNAPWFPNAKESVELSKAALKTVNERLARFKARPNEIRPPAAPGASPRSKPAPKTMLDAINNAL